MATRKSVTQARVGARHSRVAIRDIAALAGVSVATVSRVLNGRPDVSPATRETVLRHIRERGYVSNRNARALASGRTGLIGLIVPHVGGHFFAEIVAGAAEALYECDARLVVCPTRHEHERELSLLERLMHGTTDGALLVLPSESPDELERLHQQGYPFVVIDPALPVNDGIPVVAAANWAGARMATEHLIALGHERIGVITGPPTWCASVDRLAGYHSALLAARCPIRPELVCTGDFTIAGGHRAAHHLLALPDAPTAIFALDDDMAIGVLRAARERGVQVPRDLSVVGFDDVEPALIASPTLTTVRQPLQEMGRVGAALLYRLLDGQPLDATRVELSTRLVVRESTAPPPSR
jgi:DNA-binding LacI/PurR family transcriptional regulator